MAKFEGNVVVRVTKSRPDLGVRLIRDPKGSHNADDPKAILEAAKAAVKATNQDLDKWSFYLPGFNEKFPKTQKLVPSKMFEESEKQGAVPRLTVGKFGKPKLTFSAPVKTIKGSDPDDVLNF